MPNIKVSNESLNLLKQIRENISKSLDTKVSYDDVLKLNLNANRVLVIQKEAGKKKTLSNIFGEVLGNER